MKKNFYKNISIDNNNVIWKILDILNFNKLEKKKFTENYINIFTISKKLNDIKTKNLSTKKKINLIQNIKLSNKFIYNYNQSKFILEQINKKTQYGGGQQNKSKLMTILLFPLWKIETKLPITTELFDSISKLFQKSKIVSKTFAPLIESMLATANMAGNIDLIEKVLDEIIIIISIMYNFSRKHIIIASIDAFQHFPLMKAYIDSLDYSIKDDIRELEKKYNDDGYQNIEKINDLLDNVLEIIKNVENSLGENYQYFKKNKLNKNMEILDQ